MQHFAQLCCFKCASWPGLCDEPGTCAQLNQTVVRRDLKQAFFHCALLPRKDNCGKSPSVVQSSRVTKVFVTRFNI